MKMITNYLNTLESYLPEESQKEIIEELESSLFEQVEDKQKELGREINDQEQADILLKIGHPLRVASAYLPNQELINSDYFPAYKQALYMATSIFAVITLIGTIALNYDSSGIIGGLFSIIFNIVEISLDVFIVVTGIFYLMQRYEVDLNELYAWNPRKLSHKGKKLSLSRFEVFFEMVFELLFLLIWNQLFMAENVIIDNATIDSFSKSAEWQSVYIPMNIVVGLSFLINIVKFIKSSWTSKLLLTNLVNNIVGVVVLIYVLQFEQYVIFDAIQSEVSNLSELARVIEWSIKSTIIFIIAVSLWDSYSHFKELKRKP